MSSSVRRTYPALRAKPLVALLLPAILLAGCAPYRYADRGPQGDPYGIAMREAALGPAAATSTYAKPERHRRAAKIAQKAKHASKPILRKDPVLTEVDKALTKPAPAPASPAPAAQAAVVPAPQASASAAPQTITESSVTVSSARAPVILNAPAGSAPVRASVQPEATPAFTTATSSKLVEQGRALFRAGQIVKAREKFMAALVELAPGRVPQVLPDLARTYDPYYLQQVPKADVKPNPAMALAIYQRASLSGSSAWEADIQRLERERN